MDRELENLRRQLAIADEISGGKASMDQAAAIVDFDWLGDEFCALIEEAGAEPNPA